MHIKAELNCLNCGRLLGEATGLLSRPLSAATLSCPSGEPCLTSAAGRGLRCRFCGGRAIIENIDALPSEQRVA